MTQKRNILYVIRQTDDRSVTGLGGKREHLRERSAKKCFNNIVEQFQNNVPQQIVAKTVNISSSKVISSEDSENLEKSLHEGPG